MHRQRLRRGFKMTLGATSLAFLDGSVGLLACITTSDAVPRAAASRRHPAGSVPRLAGGSCLDTRIPRGSRRRTLQASGFGGRGTRAGHNVSAQWPDGSHRMPGRLSPAGAPRGAVYQIHTIAGHAGGQAAALRHEPSAGRDHAHDQMDSTLRLPPAAALRAGGVCRRQRDAGRGKGDGDPRRGTAQDRGAEKAFPEFDKGAAFHDRDLYVMVYDQAGKCVSHGANAGLIGKSLIDLKDTDGTYLIKALVAVQDAGWIDYKWPNPVTKKIAPKTTYVIRVGDYHVGVGAYK